MKRSWLAMTVLAIGAVAMLVVWFGFGFDRDEHRHGTEASAVLAGASGTGAAAAGSSGAGGSTAGATPETASSAETSAAGEHAAHEAAVSSVSAAAGTEAVAATDIPAPSAPDDPRAPAADRRQVSLAEAAGAAAGAVAPIVAQSTVADQWLDADAAGVNEGTKQQAAEVTMQPAPRVDPTEVLPAHGLTNGCVAGYGGGTACLPQTPPSHAGHGSGQDMSIYWTCAEARTLLPDGIAVDANGGDPLGLDSNKDGIACGPGDREG